MATNEASHLCDADLVRRAQAGDSHAFASLYVAHRGAVTAAVRGNMGDRDTVDDVVQETFLKALERLGTLRDPAKFRPWVLATARHAAVDHARHRARITLCGDDHDPLDRDVAPSETPEQILEAVELASLLQAHVSRLSHRDARAIALVCQPGCGPTEVAAAFMVSISAAKVLVHRARRRLRTAVGNELALRESA
jgi:RNA polymerase sigma-70 factor (ECF subfamily)